MAIDADLSAGLIDEKDARRRRKQLETKARSTAPWTAPRKFVRGDAIAGLLVVFINIIGGMIRRPSRSRASALPRLGAATRC